MPQLVAVPFLWEETDSEPQGSKTFFLDVITVNHGAGNHGTGIGPFVRKVPISSDAVRAIEVHVERKSLGDHIDIVLNAYDDRGARWFRRRLRPSKRPSAHGMAFFIVETASQFSRALDLARQWRSADVEVVLGGAFIGDCLLRSSRLPSQLQKALDCDVSLFGGDVGQHFDRVLLDAFSGTLSQVYDFSSDLAEALVRDPISVPASAPLSLRAWSKDRAGRSLSLFPKLLRRWAHALRAPADRHQVVLMRLADPDGDAGKIMSSDVVVRMRRAA